MAKNNRLQILRSRYLIGVIVLLCVLIAIAAYRVLFSLELGSEAERRRENLEALSQSFGATLRKYEELPLVVAQDPRVRNAVSHPEKSGALLQANRYLERINLILGTETIYAMNSHGLTIISSNWDKPDSYVGDNYAFRPYFRDAVTQGVGKFFGIGVASGKPGYYIAYPISNDQDLTGVVTIKIGLDGILNQLKEEKSILMVTNEDGIVILSTDRELLYKSTRPLSSDARDRIAQTRQFATQPLDALMLNGQTLNLQQVSALGQLPGGQYLVQSIPLGSQGWHIAQIGDAREARDYAMASSAAIGFGIASILLTLLNFWNRRLDRREKQAIYADIDRKIAEHTYSLTTKVAELEKAELVLRETRDEAVQAGKMAVLGQMAAGITHELSQPLSAIQLYAGNTRKLIDAGRFDVATENIDNINALVARAGSILSELKSLYRNDPTTMVRVPLDQMVKNALIVMKPFIDKASIKLDVSVAGECVIGTPGKLEQVLINLLSNAVDALRGRDNPSIAITAETVGADVVVRVRDNGPGIPESQVAAIFEPFYTTKPLGQGLGLGLAITRFIVDAVGGRIGCANLPEGGLEFTLYLRNADTAS